jgi:Folate-sensitive fragile site protein Fra10Ac1
MRWRTIEEVKTGKGEGICANVACARTEGLEGMEVMFGYVEDEKQKNVLVKCVLCKKCRHKMRKARGSEKSKKKSNSHETKDETQRTRHHRVDSQSEIYRNKRRREGSDVESDGRSRSPSNKPRSHRRNDFLEEHSEATPGKESHHCG